METIIFSQKKELSNLHLAPFSLAPKQTSCRMETVKHTLPVPLTIPQNTLSSPRRPSQNGELQPKKICLDWITAIALVKFDIDKGNVIDSIYPSNIFSKSEQKTISLLSFPDSNSFAGEGHLKFVFRLNRDHNCDFRSLFGYVYFNQQRDPANPRGFSQNSLVIFSVLPFSGFFKNAMSILGARYFGQKNAYESEQYLKENFEIMTSEWPKPEPGIQYELNLHGYNLSLNMPKNIYESKHIHMKSNTKDVRLSQEQRSFESAESPAKEVLSDEDEVKEPVVIPVSEEREQSLSTILSGFNLLEKGCFQDINLYKIFKGNKLSSLWKAWECILTNQPLMVMADLPSQCSEAVLGLLSTIYPLEYQTDYKPYFTIYDPDYREIQDLHDKKVAKCAVMGVTNPLFLKVLQNYPNILHLEEDYLKNKKSSSKKTTLLESTQKLYTQPDPMIKKMLIPSDSDEADAINDSLLRKSLQNLTENFLSAFHVYLRLQINDIKKFDEKEFMKFLEIQKFPFKGQFSSQKHILKLYAKFIKSANFQKFIKNFPNVYIVKKAEKS